MTTRNQLENELEELEALLEDREKALPAHSVSYQQLQLIEELEEAMDRKRKEIQALEEEA